jgi:ATP-dependent Lhr-like helicase
MTSYEEAPYFFKDLKYVIIDELHALMHSKRGDLLALNLERLSSFAPKAQRIGLSATVPDKKTAKDYLCRDRKGKIVDVEPRVKPHIEILLGQNRMPWSGHMGSYAVPDVYKAIAKANMSVVFVNTRAQAEMTFQKLWAENDKNLRIAVHHGSLEKELRRKVEAKMAAGEIDCVVATASLDLGLDWANVDLVVQIGAPKGVSRLLQRIGRSNHRLNEPSRAILVPSNRFEYMECLAAKNAIDKGHLDGVPEKTGGLDVLAQHITGAAISAPFIPEAFYQEVIKAWPYRDLQYDDFKRVLDFVKNGGYALKSYDRYARLIETDDGKVHIADKKFIRPYRMNIGTIVESHMLKVKLKLKTLGKIEEWFVQGLTPGDTFIFGGQVLKFLSVSDQGVQVAKTADAQPKIPSYAGGRMPLSTQLAAEVRAMLSSPRQWGDFPAPVKDWLSLQKKKSLLPSKDGLLVESFMRGKGRAKRHFMVTYPFEGRNAHQTLGFLLSRRMHRFGFKPLGFIATDYAIAAWCMNPIEKIDKLFSQDMMLDDLHEWLLETPLLKRNFRDVAVISGLIERRLPGQVKTGKQVTMNTDLIYDVLMKYEPDHILLKAAQDDARGGLIDLGRLGQMLARIEGKIVHHRLEYASPLAVPLILEISRETIPKKDVAEFYLQEFEDELLEEVGLS